VQREKQGRDDEMKAVMKITILAKIFACFTEWILDFDV